MDKYFVLVAGSGASSRANIEALIEDHIYANGPEVTFVLPFKDTVSQGQIFLAQYAKDKGKDLVLFAPPSANLSQVPNGSFSPAENPIEEAIDFVEGQKAFAFFLWDDADADLVNAANKCSIVGLNVYDLTDGLNLIGPTAEVKVETPTIPEAETIMPTLSFAMDEDEYEDEDDEEYEDDEEDMDDDILAVSYALVEALTDIVTKKVLEALEAQAQDAPKKPSKGDKR